MFTFPAYVITMKSSEEQMLIKEYIYEHGFVKISLFQGVDGKKVDLDNDILLTPYARAVIDGKLKRKNSAVLCSRGAVGCFLSHQTIWKNFLSTDSQWCAIFEDDVRFNKSFQKDFVPLWNDVRTHTDDPLMLNLGFGPLSPHTTIHQEGKRYDVLQGIFWGLHSYIINRAAARKMLTNTDIYDVQVDTHISLCKGLRILCPRRNLTSQQLRYLESSTQTKCLVCLLPANNMFYALSISIFIFLFAIGIYASSYNKDLQLTLIIGLSVLACAQYETYRNSKSF